jgi:hypothetical protein
MWHKALDELGEKVCELYPFICDICHETGHFNFQCSGHNNDLYHPMRTAILSCDDKITPNQLMSLLYFWGMKSYLERLLW